MKTATTTARPFTTKTLAYCALLAALSVVLARFLIPMPNVTTRFSIEAVPIFLAGMLFGPGRRWPQPTPRRPACRSPF